MGTDIDICVNNHEDIYTEGFSLPVSMDYNEYSLSRSFCRLILNSIRGDGQELRQLELLTSIDLSCLYQMGDAPYNSETLEITLKSIKSDVEKEKLSEEETAKKAAVNENVGKVLETIQKLITALNSVNNLPELMPQHPRINKDYYADFSLGEEGDYPRNRQYFGKDLRNFEK
jgi:hypothetical protein